MLHKRRSWQTTRRQMTFFTLLVSILVLSVAGVFSSNYGTTQAAPLAAEPVSVITSPLNGEDGGPIDPATVTGQPHNSDGMRAPTASSNTWQRTNPGGGGAFSTVGAGPSGIIIAASDLAGAYRSMDRGQTWDLIGSYRGLTSTHVGGIGFNPVDASKIYLATEIGIFRSVDFGANFEFVGADGYLDDVAIAFSNPDVGFAAFHSAWNQADGVIYKSTNDGLTWSQISNNSLPSNLKILEIQINPQDENVLYLLAGEGRFACGPAVLYESVDGGVNWRQIASSQGQIMDFALDTNDPNVMYVTTYGDVWDDGYNCVSDDASGGYLYKGIVGGGDWSWTPLTNDSNLGSRNTYIWLDRDDGAVRLIDLIHSGAELWETTDDGANWTMIGNEDDWEDGWTDTFGYGASFNGHAKTHGDDLSDPDALWWVDRQFVYGTLDDGRNFSNFYANEVAPGKWQSRGVDNIVTLDVEISPANSNYIYLALADMGCFRSDDYGASWQNCNDPNYTGRWGLNGGNSMTVAADPDRANVVWISQSHWILESQHTLLKSSDYGMTWNSSHTGLPTNQSILNGLSVDPNSPTSNRTLFVTADGDLYRSTDDGNLWSMVLDCNGCHFSAVDNFDSNLVYAGGEAGLWRSEDGGETWIETGLPEMRGSLGSQFWRKYWEGVVSIEPDPNNPDWVYVAVFGSGKGLYRSQSRGESGSWQKLWTDNFMRDVAVTPGNANTLYATSTSALFHGGFHSTSNGVLQSVDGGQNWTVVNDGLSWPFASPVEIDPNNPSTVFIGSPGGGYYHRNFGQSQPPAIELEIHLPIVRQWLEQFYPNGNSAR